MSMEKEDNQNVQAPGKIVDREMIMSDLTEWFTGFQKTFQSLMALGNLRDRQKPLMRLYQDILLGELRSSGVIHVAEQEANSLLYQQITTFDPDEKELKNTVVHGGSVKLDPAKPHWSFIMNDLDYDHDQEGIEWRLGLRFGFGTTVKDQGSDQPGLWQTTAMTYSPDRVLTVAGKDITFRKKLNFDPEESRNFIYPPEDFDLKAFRRGLRRGLKNPKGYRQGRG